MDITLEKIVCRKPTTMSNNFNINDVVKFKKKSTVFKNEQYRIIGIELDNNGRILYYGKGTCHGSCAGIGEIPEEDLKLVNINEVVNDRP